jgi:GT2 family glycosyltransferase
MLSTAVVICAYSDQRWDLLADGIEAVLDQSLPPARLLVVIDYNEELLERVRQRFGDRVVAMDNAEQQGLSGARNTGVAAAREDVIAFLDDDALPERDWLERLVTSYEQGVLGVGGAIEPRWASRRPSWFPPEFDWVVGCTYLGMPEAAAPVRNMIGANMSLRREVFERVGGFAHELGHKGAVPFGCEETELCIRAQQAIPDGWIRHQPSARVHHWVSEERSRFAYFRQRCFAEGGGKALMTSLVGSDDGLSSERRYTLRVLPAGVLRGATASLRERNLDGLSRAAAILAGLALVGAGYLRGRLFAGTGKT